MPRKPAKRVKTTRKPSAQPSGKKTERQLVPQPHGGALLPGAGGGPQPGSGRPPSELRERLKGSLAERVKIIEEIADEITHSAADRLRAIDLLAKYGLGTKEEITLVSEDVRTRLERQVSLIAARPTWTREDLLTELGAIWS